MSRTRDRYAAEAAGRLGEWAAGWFMRLKGFRIVARRFRTPVGELDLIARRGRLLVFVEVKLRAGRKQGLEALGLRQQWRIRRAADWYLARHSELRRLDCRFDLIAMAPWRLPRHVKDIWRD